MMKRIGGHPSRQDPTSSRLFKVMESSYQLVFDLQLFVSKEDLDNLRAAANGLTTVYEVFTQRLNPPIMLKDALVPTLEELTADLYKTLTNLVKLVDVIDGRVDRETHYLLRSSTLGMMHVYASLTGKPAPTIVAREVYQALIVRELAESATV